MRKVCRFCGVEKDESEFYKNRYHKCKKCDLEYCAEYRKSNRESINQKRKDRYWEDPDKAKERHRQWYYRDVDKTRAYLREQKKRDYHSKPNIRAGILVRRKQWAIDNPEEVRREYNEWRRSKFESSPAFRLEYSIRKRLNDGIHRGSWSKESERIYGATLEVIKQHLASTAIRYPDFDIEHYDGRLFNIDHILPISSVDLSKDSDILKFFNYTNLQILSKEEHKAKHGLI